MVWGHAVLLDLSCDALSSLLLESSRPPTYHVSILAHSPLQNPSPPVFLSALALSYRFIRMARMKFVPASIGEKKTRNPLAPPRSEASPSSFLATNETPPVTPTKSTDDLSAESKMPFSEFTASEIQWAKSSARKDHLLHLPPKNHLYVDKNGHQRILDTRYDQTKSPYCRVEVIRKRRLKKPHPKLVAARANKTVNDQLEAYYMYFETSTHKGQAIWHHIPLAGTPRAVCFSPTHWQALTHSPPHMTELAAMDSSESSCA